MYTNVHSHTKWFTIHYAHDSGYSNKKDKKIKEAKRKKENNQPTADYMTV